jgi:hypothetical protein
MIATAGGADDDIGNDKKDYVRIIALEGAYSFAMHKKDYVRTLGVADVCSPCLNKKNYVQSALRANLSLLRPVRRSLRCIVEERREIDGLKCVESFLGQHRQHGAG